MLGPLSTYFGTVKTNCQGMLYLHYFIRLRKAHHLSNICDQLKLDAEYAADMVKFIDEIIYYSILEKRSNVIGDEALSALSSKTDQEFMLK